MAHIKEERNSCAWTSVRGGGNENAREGSTSTGPSTSSSSPLSLARGLGNNSFGQRLNHAYIQQKFHMFANPRMNMHYMDAQMEESEDEDEDPYYLGFCDVETSCSNDDSFFEEKAGSKKKLSSSSLKSNISNCSPSNEEAIAVLGGKTSLATDPSPLIQSNKTNTSFGAMFKEMEKKKAEAFGI
eukprot:Nk52_evm26s2630 gene=Nk52_evmTU26s2630